MKTLLILSACLLSACTSTEFRSSATAPDTSATTAAAPADPAGDRPDRGRRAALWTGLGFAVFAIYEASDDDDEPSDPLGSCLSLKCWQ